MSLDMNTVDTLHKAAQKHYERARKVYLKTDCADSMHQMEAWAQALEWLRGILGGVKP